MTRPNIHAGHDGEYKHCKQEPCAGHKRRYHKRWAYDRSHGQLRLVDATQARLHIAGLLGAGWSYRAIAGAAGVSPTSAHRIGRSLNTTIQRKVEQAILEVTGLPSTPTKDATEPFVPRTGTNRRLQALLYMGWTHQAMKAESGIRTSVLLNQQGRWVTKSTHDAVCAMFSRLAMKQGPSAATRGRARRLGYAGPLDWDDIDHDAAPIQARDSVAPTYDYDEVVVERFLAGDHSIRTSIHEKREIVRRWPGSLYELEQLGWKPERYVNREEAA